jgi:glycosyltransferase involved in cell wall biosynthesis
MSNQLKISAFVITYNRAKYLQAVLRRLRWVDELWVLDKGSIDDTASIVAMEATHSKNLLYLHCDWSPTVEPTRIYAQSLCVHDWILCLDDDEILSPDAETSFRTFANDPNYDIYFLPIDNYILGTIANIEYRPCFYRRNALTYRPTVHSKPILNSDKTAQVDGPTLRITHLSHPNISSWIEKTNRYTDQKDRAIDESVVKLAEIIGDKTQLPFVIERLHALYLQIDAMKLWESRHLPDGNAVFDEILNNVLRE